jgi:hypothetical protein
MSSDLGVAGVLLAGLGLYLSAEIEWTMEQHAHETSQQHEAVLRAMPQGSEFSIADHNRGTHTCYVFNSFQRINEMQLSVEARENGESRQIDLPANPNIVLFLGCTSLS